MADKAGKWSKSRVRLPCYAISGKLVSELSDQMALSDFFVNQAGELVFILINRFCGLLQQFKVVEQ